MHADRFSKNPVAHYIYRTFADPTCRRYVIWHQLVNLFIFISCLALAGESVDTFAEQHQGAFELVENISLAFFTIDFLGALYVAENRMGYVTSFWGIVDILSIAPSYLMMLNMTFLQGTKVFRLLRVVRVLRVLKLARAAMSSVSDISTKKSNPIIVNLRIYLIALFSVMMISSTLMYYVEGGLYTTEAMTHGQAAMEAQALKDGQPVPTEKFMPIDPISGNPIPEDKRVFTSIPAAMWWCITTLTTTGYGDLYPVTVGGRLIAGVTMLMGLVLFGVLMNIVGKTLMVMLFGETVEHEHKKPEDDRAAAAFLLLTEGGLISPEQAHRLQALPVKQLRDALDSIPAPPAPLARRPDQTTVPV